MEACAWLQPVGPDGLKPQVRASIDRAVRDAVWHSQGSELLQHLFSISRGR